jgi:NTP pyrophosphatase (non-canonical NTP hydrolase)
MEPGPELGLAALQARVRAFDEARGWEVVDPAHTGLHLLEELGEVARELLRLAGYKRSEPGALERLGGELADLALLAAKLANGFGLDLEREAAAKLEANEARYPIEASREAMAAYLARRGEP